MELHLTLTRRRGHTLPVNYQYALSSWIYKVISKADADYSTFLHEKGFAFESKRFKMFTFSQLDVRPYEMLGNEIKLLGNKISFTVRFLVDASLEHFVKGLFMHQHCGIGSPGNVHHVDFEVTGVETKPAPLFRETMQYQCLSPIVVSTLRDNRTVAYLSPDEPAFGRILIQNLVRKQQALVVHEGEVIAEQPLHGGTFRLLNTPRKKGTIIKENTTSETKVIAYLFRFELTASRELHEIGYYAGFGEKNSMGFGCVSTYNF